MNPGPDIILTDIRCFAKRHQVPLRPLTLLVGENSAGKSTFMAAAAVALDSSNYPGNPQFNRPPYDLGNFDTIASFVGGRRGRASKFSLGYGFHGEGGRCEVIATYDSHFGRVHCGGFSVESPLGKIEFGISGQELTGGLTFHHEGRIETLELRQKLGQTTVLNMDFIASLVFRTFLRARPQESGLPRIPMFVGERIRRLLHQAFDAVSVAPVRSKPRRTYDRISQEFDPEGDHVPFELARVFLEEKSAGEGAELLKWLQTFGDASGLYRRLAPKRLGRKPGAPFQIEVTVAGRPANLTDVGYGVSQSLPIVVQSVLADASPRVFLQQPEVHLHPRAQAALGSFFCQLVADGDRQFMIETHSDFLIDRVRQQVAERKLEADKVSIIYFHKPDHETTVHEMHLDEQGNILNAPPHYREFFFREEDRLLGGGSILNDASDR